jgi:hypothetical protein
MDSAVNFHFDGAFICCMLISIEEVLLHLNCVIYMDKYLDTIR